MFVPLIVHSPEPGERVQSIVRLEEGEEERGQHERRAKVGGGSISYRALWAMPRTMILLIKRWETTKGS